MLHTVMWPARLHGIFPHDLTNDTIFERRGKKVKHVMCVFFSYFLYNFCLKHFSIYEELSGEM